MTPQRAPERHQPEVRDVTISKRENEVRPVKRVHANRLCRPFAALCRHGDFRAIPPLVETLHDFGVLDLEFAEPPQCLTDDRALGLKLGIVGEMLELTAAAMIADVVRAWWRDSPRAGFDDFADVRAGEVAMALQRPFPQSDPIAGRGPGYEHDATIAQPTHADSPGAVRPSGRAAVVIDRRSSATIAAATANARSNPGRGGAASTRAPARSRYLMSISPFRNSASSMTRR